MLADSGGSSVPAAKCPAPDVDSAQLPPSTSRATGEQAAFGGRHVVSPVGGATYTAVAAATAVPQQPSGPLKPTAKGSDPSEPTISHKMAKRRMSLDMSGRMSGMPGCTTTNAQVGNASLPAGVCINRTPIFNSGFNDTRPFLAWLRESCPSQLSAQLKAENLVVFPATADGFRGAVSALRSLDGESGVTFHTYSLPEDRCVRLLIKNHGRTMPENVVLEEPRSLDIHVQGVMQLRSVRRDQDPDKDRPSTPTS